MRFEAEGLHHAHALREVGHRVLNHEEAPAGRQPPRGLGNNIVDHLSAVWTRVVGVISLGCLGRGSWAGFDTTTSTVSPEGSGMMDWPIGKWTKRSRTSLSSALCRAA